MYTVDIDVGGTLTDGLFSDGQTVIPVKVDTTAHDLTVCFLDCLTEGARQLGFNELAAFLNQVRLIRWSTTITSNVVAQRTGPKLGLFVSQGHERDLYSQNGPSAALNTLVTDTNVVGFSRPVDPTKVLQAVKRLLENGVRRICVSLDGAFQEATDERAIKRIIEAQYPDHFLGAVPVLLGSDVSHYPDDMTRTHHALINAYVHGSLATSLYKAEDDLRAAGYDRPLLIGHANGGVARVAKTKALDTLESGPTMGLFAAAYFAQRYGLKQVIALDVGGTTTKMGIIREGRPELTHEIDVFGIPVWAPAVLVRSIALGGGSVVRVDADTRQLQLGPESMGAYPGPACYDLGGTEPTLTDTLLTLNWLNPAYFMGGARKLNVDRAREALKREIVGPLDMSIEQAAIVAVDTAFQEVAHTIGNMLKEMNWHPEDCVLFAFGGNGPIFACGIAERAGISQAYVFSLSPVFSAFGSSVSDIVHVYEHGLNQALDSPGAGDRLAEIVGRMRDEALRDMKGEGIDPTQVNLTLELELGGELVTAPVEAALQSNLSVIPRVAEGAEVKLVRLRAVYPMPHYEPSRQPLAPGAPTEAVKGQREVVWGGSQVGSGTVYDWAALRPGQQVSGGAILESAATTYSILPGWTIAIDELGNGQLTRG